MTDKKLISSLQGLRAVAFLCVVISHCGAPWLGPWAISVFVALSGFLMVCNYYDRPRTAPGLQSAIAFSFKKIRRLYPLHLIMMAAALLFVLKGLLAQPSARGVLSCAAQLAVSIFLLQTFVLLIFLLAAHFVGQNRAAPKPPTYNLWISTSPQPVSK